MLAMDANMSTNFTLPVREFDNQPADINELQIWPALGVKSAQKLAGIGDNQNVQVFKPNFDNPDYDAKNIYVIACINDWGYDEMLTLTEYVESAQLNEAGGERILHIVYVENMLNSLKLATARKIKPVPEQVDLVMYGNSVVADVLTKLTELLHVRQDGLFTEPAELQTKVAKWVQENS